MRARMIALHMLAVALLIVSPRLMAQVSVQVTGDDVLAHVVVDDGGSNIYSADFKLNFHHAVNLTANCLGISAQYLDGSAQAALAARLPDAVRYAIDPAFPVLIRVDPPPGCGLSFEREVEFEIETTDLVYAANSPYRLLKGPIGGALANVTGDILQGSIRAHGSGGGFSDFLIVKDQAPAHFTDADTGFDELFSEVDDPDIGLAVRDILQADVTVARAAFDANDINAALAALLQFEGHVQQFAGAGIPDEWNSSDHVPEEAGELLGVSRALRFDLRRYAGLP